MTRAEIEQWKRTKIPVGEQLRADIRWWIALLRHLNGSVKMRRTSDLQQQPDWLVWTDASNFAMSGVHGSEAWQRQYDGDLAYMRNPRITIAAKEMTAVAIACAEWGLGWEGTHVRFFCDNKGDVDSFKRKRNKNPLTLHMMRVISLLATKFKFSFDLIWIPTEKNVVADPVSRLPLLELADHPECSALTIRPSTWSPPRQDDPNWEEELLEAISRQICATRVTSPATDSIGSAPLAK
jgi:hypothetical protein